MSGNGWLCDKVRILFWNWLKSSPFFHAECASCGVLAGGAECEWAQQRVFVCISASEVRKKVHPTHEVLSDEPLWCSEGLFSTRMRSSLRRLSLGETQFLEGFLRSAESETVVGAIVHEFQLLIGDVDGVNEIFVHDQAFPHA